MPNDPNTSMNAPTEIIIVSRKLLFNNDSNAKFKP